jgi:uncharacterized protein (DUF3084 family)
MLITSWHAQGYQAARREAEAGSRFVEFLGLALEVPAEVRAPAPEAADVLGNVRHRFAGSRRATSWRRQPPTRATA